MLLYENNIPEDELDHGDVFVDNEAGECLVVRFIDLVALAPGPGYSQVRPLVKLRSPLRDAKVGSLGSGYAVDIGTP